ncbi:tetraacyldisaccharide 4'-kinase [Methylophaga sulfidovorans]|uniref:Tetraacyldisaccharide 4'-kinase n=1 Tax=Methylophaga sulfidovorans TaxID=45496 RepID=A0A1I3XGT6_9GAMM|nr:tetraacyldisaccharide 4'-kinase [Methylophaga sulfidovorans]SFK18718.1 lipid-A-disaccharide kinase [Methylophaga sulfidovorans]
MHWLTDSWYQSATKYWFLLPLSWLYRFIVLCRQWAYRKGLFTTHKMPVPVIVVGNITVGGTGKTPFVIWLAEQLTLAGYKPGIISRGYGGSSRKYPLEVHKNSNAKQCGDEPLLIAKRSGCPVVVDPDRPQAAIHLLSQYHCDVLISDDGLQHYALQRDIEIILVDGSRRFGNKHCLPVGPLREPISRLTFVDFIIYNGSGDEHNPSMQLKAMHWVNVHDETVTMPLTHFRHKEVHAVAGIGHPKRFFDALVATDIIVHPHAFADHHQYLPEDLRFYDELPILMTEKDAVKCQSFANKNMWYLPVEATLDSPLFPAIHQKLKERSHG